jgi:hypothetical protein
MSRKSETGILACIVVALRGEKAAHYCLTKPKAKIAFRQCVDACRQHRIKFEPMRRRRVVQIGNGLITFYAIQGNDNAG